MNWNSRFIGIGLAVGAGFAAGMTAATHRPEMWVPLGIGIGLAVGVGIRDRKTGRPAIRQVGRPDEAKDPCIPSQMHRSFPAPKPVRMTRS